jgi:PAS domain S-box-containing protein
MEEGVVTLDRDLRALDANRAALKLLGLRSVRGFQGIKDRLIEPEVKELVFSGVEVLNAPLTWTLPGEGENNLLRSFIPIIPEGGYEVQGAALLLKPGLVSSVPPVESWLEWGRSYLNQVTSNLYEAICYLDREGRIIYANHTFEEIAGGNFSEISGKPLPSVLKPVSRPLFLMEVIEKTLREGSWQGEFEVQTGQGRRTLIATAAKVRSEKGRDLGIAVLARDITERKQLETETQWRSRELSLVYDLLQLTAGYHDIKDSLKESLSRILPIMRAEAGAIYLRDRGSDELRLAAYQGLTYRSAKELASGKEGMDLAERAMAGSRGVIINLRAEDGGANVLWGRRGPLLSLAMVPIPSRNRSAGVLMVGHKQSGRFGDEDLSVLLSLASQVGVVFELAELLEDLRGKVEELGRERDFSRAVVDTMPSALALLDSRGRIAFVNRRFTELLGYEPDEVEGQPFTMLLPPGERKRTMADIMTRERSGSVWTEIAITDKLGDVVPVLATSTPRPFVGDEYRGAVLTVTDLSQQRAAESKAMRIEETAEALSKELAGARDSLERLDAREQAYLNMVHYEVAAPLRVIKKGLRELDKEMDEIPCAEARARLKWLGREVRRLERFASDIQDVSSVERGKLRLRRREADMREITFHAVEEMRLTVDNPISLELPQRPVVGLADAGRLEQVLASLIDNAVKFSPPGSEVKVRLSQEGDNARWGVEDKGTGMSARQVQGFQDLFAGKGRPGIEVKTGLGLFLCHHILQAHKGDLRLESTPGRGTKVYFSIPLERKK